MKNNGNFFFEEVTKIASPENYRLYGITFRTADLHSHVRSNYYNNSFQNSSKPEEVGHTS